MARAVDRLAEQPVHYEQLPSSSTWKVLLRIAARSTPDDLIILNGRLGWLNRVCLLKALLPHRWASLIVVDLVLRAPSSLRGRWAAIGKRWLWRRVDLFVNYFRDLRGYSRHFGITPDRSVYVPFKPNVVDWPHDSTPDSSGEFVFMAGESMRDYGTFIEAAHITRLPTAILDPATSKRYKIPETVALPDNLTLLPDDGRVDTEKWIRNFRRARVFVACISPANICASGISCCLDAMALGKPVIITRGPGADDVMEDAAIFVPPCDPEALAQAISEIWNDSEAREQQIERALRYARNLGGSDQLLDRVLASVLRWRSQNR
jgi:glycosyltransferase involved in cell wall biosynthesis